MVVALLAFRSVPFSHVSPLRLWWPCGVAALHGMVAVKLWKPDLQCGLCPLRVSCGWLCAFAALHGVVVVHCLLLRLCPLVSSVLGSAVGGLVVL